MRAAVVALGVAVALAGARPQPAPTEPPRTRVVMLGTGTPRPEPDRSGPATAVVVGGRAYLVDIGPGIVRRAAAASAKGFPELAASRLDIAFVTHLHSDHTVGYPDLIFTPWVQGRHVPLRVYGPAGIEEMTRHIIAAWREDIEIRTNGLEHRSGGTLVEAHDVKPGVVYTDANVTVTAFQNEHGEWPQTFGYQLKTADRTIVISGDTNPSEGVIRACQACDVLIHEAFSEAFRPADIPNWIEYRSRYHTTTTQLAEIARKTRPKLLVVYHHGAGSDEQYAAEIGRAYGGPVAVAKDLDVY